MPYYAYNRRSKVVVGWLGNREKKDTMEDNLHRYNAPSYVVPRKMTDSQARRINKIKKWV